MESAIPKSPRIHRTDLVPGRSTAVSLAYLCIGLLPAFEAPLLEGKDLSWQNDPRTLLFQTPVSPKSYRLAQPTSWSNLTHFHQDRREHLQDKSTGCTHPLFLRTLTVFRVTRIKVNVSDGSIGIPDESARDEVVQII